MRRLESDAAAASNTVEIPVQCADAFEPISYDNGGMHRIVSRDRLICIDKLLRVIHHRSVDRPHFRKELPRQNHGRGSTAGTDSRSISSSVQTGRLKAVVRSISANRSARLENEYCVRHASRTNSPTLDWRCSARLANWSYKSGGNKMAAFLFSPICASLSECQIRKAIMWRKI